MSDVVDLTLFSGSLQELQREVRLKHIQLDDIVSRFSILEQRFASHEQRLAPTEQAVHSLLGEVSEGFGQVQQLTRQEKRLKTVGASLGDIRLSGAGSWRRLRSYWRLPGDKAPSSASRFSADILSPAGIDLG